MRKKILLLTSGLSSVGNDGGVASYVHDLAINLIERQYDVTVFLFQENHPPLACTQPYGYSFFRVPEKRAAEDALVVELYSAIQALTPDIIINNDVSYMSGLWPVLPESTIRIAVIHGYSRSWGFSVAGIIGKIATYNADYIDHLVCQNQSMIHEVSTKHEVPLNKLICIHQTVQYQQMERAPSPSLRIVFAGGENKAKGAQEMFKVAQLLKATDLDFVLHWCLPASTYQEKFKDDGRFLFHGQISREAFLEVLGNADCIIIPTHRDTGPLLLVEAMAQGVIPICNHINSAIPDLLVNGQNGYLVAGNVPEKYVEIIKELCETDYSPISIAAAAYFQENLSPARQIDNFERIFTKNTPVRVRQEFSKQHIVYYHRRNTANLPIYSIKKSINKIINIFEIVMTSDLYKKWFKPILK